MCTVGKERGLANDRLLVSSTFPRLTCTRRVHVRRGNVEESADQLTLADR